MMQGFVFLTYASEDSRRVQEVVRAMERRGLSVAWERFEMASELGARAQQAALEAADVILVLWSRHATASPRVLEEAARARSRGVLFQAALDDSSVPMPFVLDGVVAADDEGLPRLLDGIERKLGEADWIPQGNGPVRITLSGPPTVAPGGYFSLELWAHSQRDREEVRRLALDRTSSTRDASRGSSYATRLVAEGLSTTEPEVALGWNSGIGAARILVQAPRSPQSTACAGWLGVYVLGFRVARVHFAIQIGEFTAEPEILPSRQEWHRSAFACFAKEDETSVREKLSALERAVPELVVFAGSLELPTQGEGLAPLFDHIAERDVFYLFWSPHAAASSLVEREWRYAMRLRGREFVETIRTTPAPDAPLPPELVQAQPFVN